MIDTGFFSICILALVTSSVTLLTTTAVLYWNRSQKKSYSLTLRNLEEEQGEWFVETVLARELAKILKHNTDPADPADPADTDDDESDTDGEEKDPATLDPSPKSDSDDDEEGEDPDGLPAETDDETGGESDGDSGDSGDSDDSGDSGDSDGDEGDDGEETAQCTADEKDSKASHPVSLDSPIVRGLGAVTGCGAVTATVTATPAPKT